MRRTWPSPAALALNCLSAGLVLFWGGQARDGRFQADGLTSDVGASLFFAGPYLVLSLAALVAWGQRALALLSLLAAAVLAGIGLLTFWGDHSAYLQAPPGREPQPMLSFAATVLLVWPGSILALATVAIVRATRRRRAIALSEQPAAGP